MIDLNKRWSTWLNYIAGLLAVLMQYLPGLGFGDEWTPKIMLACSIIIHIAQRTKQKEGGSDRGNTN